jgi:hypothetical protein
VSLEGAAAGPEPGPQPPRSGLLLAALGILVSLISLTRIGRTSSVSDVVFLWLCFPIGLPISYAVLQKNLAVWTGVREDDPALPRPPNRFQFDLSELMVFTAGISLLMGATIPPFILEGRGFSYPLLLVFGLISVGVGLTWHWNWVRWVRVVRATKGAQAERLAPRTQEHATTEVPPNSAQG